MANNIFGFSTIPEDAPKTGKELIKAMKEINNDEWVKSIKEYLEASTQITEDDLRVRVQ